MKLFLASPHTILRFKDGVRYMRIYLAGGVTGNLNPAWKRMAKTEITPNGFIKGLMDENFWRGGETRHWIQDVTSPIKENENIYGGYDTVQREEKYRGGALARQYMNIDHIYLSPSTTLTKTRKGYSNILETFCLTAALLHLCKTPKHMLTGMTI